jgi:hypothetical protein
MLILPPIGQVIIALLPKTAIEQFNLAVLSPLKRHLRPQAFNFHPCSRNFHPVRAGVCGFSYRKTAKNCFVKNKLGASMRVYAIIVGYSGMRVGSRVVGEAPEM